MQLGGCIFRMSTDRIEKKILLRAPRQRVWTAISDSAEFGIWFGVKFHGPFKPGSTVGGNIVPSGANADLASAQKKYEGLKFEIEIEKMEPERLFSFRWHPYAIDPAVDYFHEPTTLVVFTLEDAEGQTLLTVTESGFDQIPLERRAKAFTANTEGWAEVTKALGDHLANLQ
jgi:uncharacterized protein YndB with AHSA1/START domain